jgi:hypothetical protein
MSKFIEEHKSVRIAIALVGLVATFWATKFVIWNLL